jgi:hypothetical protein
MKTAVQTVKKEVKKWDKRNRLIQVFSSEEEFEDICSRSSVIGRWDYEDYKGQDKQ